MTEEGSSARQEQLRARLRQLILMRETGPKRAAWHAARARLIWRLHAELRHEAEARDPDDGAPKTAEQGMAADQRY
ncbi:MAG TPA: hypothetical protein VKE41_07735 [Roseiflexaceae bacterium]|nr:hypothetical protein [Roseiflexaceae bacterium]